MTELSQLHILQQIQKCISILDAYTEYIGQTTELLEKTYYWFVSLDMIIRNAPLWIFVLNEKFLWIPYDVDDISSLFVWDTKHEWKLRFFRCIKSLQLQALIITGTKDHIKIWNSIQGSENYDGKYKLFHKDAYEKLIQKMEMITMFSS